MDTTTETALTKAHENLADDLANLSQLIQPESQQALGMLYRCQRRLEDIKELAKYTTKPPADSAVNIDDAPKGLVGLFPDDTLAHVSDALVVLSHVDYEKCGSDNDFKLGMIQILNCAMEALEFEAGRVETLRKAAKLEQHRQDRLPFRQDAAMS